MLQQKTTIVTGAGSGIGEAIALLFARNGANVLAADRHAEQAERVCAQIKAEGGEAVAVGMDVSRPMDCEDLVRQAMKRYGRLDVAVNNAGIGGASAPVGEYPIGAWDEVMAVNLRGVFLCMRYQLPAMQAGGGGSIVNISSILGQVGFASAPAYVAAKHGVVGLSKNAALEYATAGIRVNAVGPGFIHTPLVDEHLSAEQLAGVAQLHPMKRLGTAMEVAELVLWLASDKASFVTGSYFPIDGGYLAQ